MAVAASRRIIAVLAVLSLAGISARAGAQKTVTQLSGAPLATLPHSPVPGRVRSAGLWDKPNAACETKCQVFVKKGCFSRLAKKYPAADADALQEQCDDKYSLCIYDCMCNTCDKNQIIIKQ